MTNLKSDLKQFIIGDYVSIDLKNSQPFLLSILILSSACLFFNTTNAWSSNRWRTPTNEGNSTNFSMTELTCWLDKVKSILAMALKGLLQLCAMAVSARHGCSLSNPASI